MLHPIIEYEGRYFHQINGARTYYISKCGAVYSTRFNRLLQASPQTEGYPQTGFHLDNGTYKRLLIHRLVALQFVPNPDSDIKTQVNHLDRNRQNCRANNLEWVTPRENDAHARATHPRYRKPGGSSNAAPSCELVPCYHVAPTPFRFS